MKRRQAVRFVELVLRVPADARMRDLAALAGALSTMGIQVAPLAAVAAPGSDSPAPMRRGPGRPRKARPGGAGGRRRASNGTFLPGRGA